MDPELACPAHYSIINGSCYHTLWPVQLSYVVGSIILGFSNSLATLAGVGGGSIALVILMSFFHYLPKDASLIVFSCVLGTAAGNSLNLIYKAYNNKPLVQYHFAFASIPIMFTGSFVGVIMNKLLPSVVTYSIIITVFVISIKKTYHRFESEYRRQSEQNLLHAEKVVDLHEESRIQPFKDERNIFIFKNIGVLMLITATLSFIRGSSKFPSIIGLAPCSAAYWFFFLFSFVVTIAYAYRNILILKSWYSEDKAIVGQESLDVKHNIEQHIKEVILKSIGAGIFSGFGLGGGIFLVPMYRNLGCKPLEATATCAFGIFITSFINCLQAISIGAIQINQFLYFVLFLGTVGFFISKIISSQLRKRNRFSLVQGILFVLTALAIVNIPISLYKRYAENDHNLKIIFGFGHLC